ncbi:Acyl transferase/acyl hydrolase/lysophospholipase [Penicillium vulpinum]|uniref:Ketoreductase domain-containing protein n=1 Tax=Penicillium vulpinum TaxID=29845 RepID=A0A1V6SDC7_9EURO|nr:Acyl transferase/acyl hydrolase/lysophospholipase [Penicillium vulpinum]KAJ5964561.1 Acyl transferase/acyl hydrolase/lysophospholipase [Penicillium vulpinum]OQE11749.1 hypothetical protein PENVUL_c002G05777 [Penicillium vulpinum]
MKKEARNFAFLSRSGADPEQASLLVNELKAAGANVQVFRGDAGMKSDIEEVINSVPGDRPIRVVLNAATVLRVTGAKNLHEVLSHLLLDFFVTTRSVSGVLGTPGQSNYAVRNGYLDAIARYRRFHRQNSVSSILPMILGVGVIAENNKLEGSLRCKGVYGIDEEVSTALRLRSLNRFESSDHIVVGLDPMELTKATQEAGDVDSFWAPDVRFNHTVWATKSQSENVSAGGGSPCILSLLQDFESIEAVQAMREHFIAKLSRMLMLDMDEFGEESRCIAIYGVDSIIGAELRNWTFKELLGLDISFQQLLGPNLTIIKFVEHGLTRVI